MGGVCSSRPFAAVSCAIVVLFVACGDESSSPLGVSSSPLDRIGELAFPSRIRDVDILGDYAFVAGGESGFHVVDLSAPEAPILLTSINTAKDAEAVCVIRTFVNHAIRDIAVVVEGTEGLETFDITDPLNAVSFNQGTTAVVGHALFIQQPDDPEAPFIVAMAETWKGIRFFESSPQYPGLIGYNGLFASTMGSAQAVVLDRGFAFIADNEMGLSVLDARVLDLGAVVLASWVDTPGFAVGIAVAASHAYVADSAAGISVFAVDDPFAPSLESRLALAGTCWDVAVNADLGFVAAGEGGLHVLALSEPGHPALLGSEPSSEARAVVLDRRGLVIVADAEEGLLIYSGLPIVDSVPPAGIFHPTGECTIWSTVLLSWYAPGDDLYVGQADAFLIRHSLEPITTEADWDSATLAAMAGGPPSPGPVGTEHFVEVVGLLPATEYFFAIRAVDDEGNISVIAPSLPVSTSSP